MSAASLTEETAADLRYPIHRRVERCYYCLRPPLANDRLSILDDGNVRLEFKRPWSDGDGRGEAAWGRGGAGRP